MGCVMSIIECATGADWFWPVYWVGALVFFLALIRKMEVLDIVASLIVGLAWPIVLPAKLLRRLMGR
jgi:hypothetical protein